MFTAQPAWTPYLDWRWRRAQFLHENGLRLHRKDEPAVRRAVAHLKGRTDQEIVAALALQQTNDWQRWLFDARLVAGLSLDEVAARADISVPVARCYTDLFFDMGPPEATTWRALRLLPRRAFLGVDPEDLPGLLRLAAWRGGPLVLDEVARVMQTPVPSEGDIANASGDQLHRLVADLDVRTWILTMQLPLATTTPLELQTLTSLCEQVQRLRETMARNSEENVSTLVVELNSCMVLLAKGYQEYWRTVRGKAA